ncbi:Formyltransferase [Dendrothele bispora CBS 962.96]|uniref:methionyl-tRNA formyltransferase n=1 Tax=Dendrothele bispora (strain CBS 962.96) TaxID=1314807 RepID=A0A4S8MPI6_DENBC|nr:Formyltransferase [Dendrothele bispora CBS 962.96]
MWRNCSRHLSSRHEKVQSVSFRIKVQSRRRFSTSPAQSDKQFNILFLGHDEFSCLVLRELYAAQDVWKQLDLVTNPDKWVGRRSSRLAVSPLKLLGESLKLPIHLIPHEKSDFKHWMPPLLYSEPPGPGSPQNVIITASFGRILPFRILKLFPENNRLNVHPSLLPAYRGGAPLHYAILNDEKETGVCVVQMLKRSEGIDTGPIWGSRKMPLPADITTPELGRTLAVEGGQLLVSVLRDMISGTAKSVPQPKDAVAPTAPLISYRDSLIDFTSMTAPEIVRRHRAISHQRPLTAFLQSIKTLQVHSPSVVKSPPIFAPTIPGRARFSKPDNSLLIRCAGDTVLNVPRVKQEGKALLNARDWWNGAKSLGLVQNNEISFDSPNDVELYPEVEVRYFFLIGPLFFASA